MEMGNFAKLNLGNTYVEVEEVFTRAHYENFSARRGFTLASVFVEQSVRTKITFEKAALNLGMDVIAVDEQRDMESAEDLPTCFLVLPMCALFA